MSGKIQFSSIHSPVELSSVIFNWFFFSVVSHKCNVVAMRHTNSHHKTFENSLKMLFVGMAEIACKYMRLPHSHGASQSSLDDLPLYLFACAFSTAHESISRCSIHRGIWTGFRGTEWQWCVCISYCSSKWRCLCGAQAMQTTLRLQTNREARSIENLRGFDHVVCHAAHTSSHLYLCKHRYFLVSTAISPLLFAPPNCESAGISCVLCVVWPCGAR